MSETTQETTARQQAEFDKQSREWDENQKHFRRQVWLWYAGWIVNIVEIGLLSAIAWRVFQ